MAFLACSPCGRALSLDAVWRRWRTASPTRHPEAPPGTRWPLELLFVALASFYFQAGFAKLSVGGLAWADGYTLQYYLIDKGAPAGAWIAASLPACRVLSILVLALELTFPLAIVIRPLRPLYLAGGFAFHLGTTWLMGLSFYPVWILYLVFVPWARLVDLLTRRSSSRRRGDVTQVAAEGSA
jgi:hypothetical protein